MLKFIEIILGKWLFVKFRKIKNVPICVPPRSSSILWDLICVPPHLTSIFWELVFSKSAYHPIWPVFFWALAFLSYFFKMSRATTGLDGYFLTTFILSFKGCKEAAFLSAWTSGIYSCGPIASSCRLLSTYASPTWSSYEFYLFKEAAQCCSL